MSINITDVIASEVAVAANQVQAAIKLLDNGDTVPFIARYRKEATGALSDTHLRTIAERLQYLREIQERKEAILKSIDEQGKLTEELANSIQETLSKARLEDLYKPYKPKRRTRGQIAIEAGLEPLAELIFSNHHTNPEQAALEYLNPEANINTKEDALEGAKYILMERMANTADLVGKLRDHLWDTGTLNAQVIEDKKEESAAQKFRDYFDFQEAIKKIPSHRALAILRGRNEGFLKINIDSEQNCESMISSFFDIKNDEQLAASAWLLEVVRWSWIVKLKVQLEVDLLGKVREMAEDQAIDVFGHNLHDLLMTPPAGHIATIGLDPGLRTGVKVAVVDNTGKLLDTATIYPHAPQNQWQRALHTLEQLCQKHQVKLISIGNGTASRETDKLAKDLITKLKDDDIKKIVVSEAGASVYSASEYASKEFPDLDVSLRGAVSIARRIQDPLAELVKIEPKAIGIGQYQHDVSQVKLSRRLDAVIEDCVNSVGVDLNTASEPLLSKVAGLNFSIAGNIVNYRNVHGKFTNREELKNVPRLGPKAFEQAAGFLRIVNGSQPLDCSAVHPESYPVVEKILANKQISSSIQDIKQLIGNKPALDKIAIDDLISDEVGIHTIEDIIKELEKPGRDPRPQFQAVKFKSGVETIKDLEPNQILEGVVTNVANFGAFIDIGVHQDGLVHISELADHYIKDPRDVVKTGDIVKVRVIEVDIPRKRINLSMKLNSTSKPSNQPKKSTISPTEKVKGNKGNKGNLQKPQKRQQVASSSAFAATLQRAMQKVKETN